MIRCLAKFHRLFTLSTMWALLLAVSLCGISYAAHTGEPKRNTPRVIVLVWDGLRPDMVNITDTPNLAKLREQGVEFLDHHSTYPSLTMINAASFATGAYPGTHGFYGNVIWVPQAQGKDSSGHIIDFTQPMFTEDYAILQDLDNAVAGKLLRVPTLFEIAQRANISTAVVGKGGPTFLQNRHGSDVFVDDKTVMPLTLAKALSAASIPLPRLWANAYPAGIDTSFAVTANPTAGGVVPRLNDGITSDPTRIDVAPFVAINAYHARVFLDYVLPNVKPQLAMLWLRNPDSTEHAFGPGSLATRAALHANDAILGTLLERLQALDLSASTNIIVVSDHGHSHVSGSLTQFPLRAIRDGEVGAIDSSGFSVSGEVRTADLLRRAGLLAFDGSPEQCNPVMSGVSAAGVNIYTQHALELQSACKSAPITGSFLAPSAVYSQQPYAVIAAEGGSEYFYVPSHERQFVQRVVRFLQSRKQYGAIFIDSQRYGELPGTLPLAAVHLATADHTNPDLIVSFNFDADASITGVPGIEYSSSGSSNRGMHGSFSPRDIHNVLIANGPDFKRGFRDDLPSGNVDVAPTIANLLGLALPNADGRVLIEAMHNSASTLPQVRGVLLRPKQPATQLQVVEATDPDGHQVDATLSQYSIELHTKVVRQKVGQASREYQYFDSAQPMRH